MTYLCAPVQRLWISRPTVGARESWATCLAIVAAPLPGYVVVDGDAGVAGGPDAAIERLAVGQGAPALAQQASCWEVSILEPAMATAGLARYESACCQVCVSGHWAHEELSLGGGQTWSRTSVPSIDGHVMRHALHRAAARVDRACAQMIE